MIYIITGATSFIGVELCKLCLEKGDFVYAVCRKKSQKQTDFPLSTHLKVIYLDMAEYKRLPSLISNADIFVNLAWKGTTHEDRDTVEIQNENIEYSIDAFHAASVIGCKLFVESGSQAEYGIVEGRISEHTSAHPFSEYGKAKLKMKELGFQLSEATRVKYLHLRIFSLFGENDHPWTLIMSCVDKMLRNEDVDLSSCTQMWNFLYVKDACRQIYLLSLYALKEESFVHEVYNIASNDTRPLKEFVENIKKLTHSYSKLNYGVINPKQMVSLNPIVIKTETTIGLLGEYTFNQVINKIINLKKYDKDK